MAENEAPNLPDAQQVSTLIDDLEQRFAQLKTWKQKSDQQAQDLREQAKTLRDEREQLGQALQELEQHRTDLKEREQIVLAQAEKAQAELADARAEREQVETENQKLNERLQAQQLEIEQAREQNGQLAEQIEQRSQELVAQQATLTERQERFNAQNAELAAKRDEFDARQSQLDTQRSALDETRKQLVQEQHTQAEKQAALEEEHAVLRARQDRLAAREAEADSLRKELDALREQTANAPSPSADVDHSAITEQLEADGRKLEQQQRQVQQKEKEAITALEQAQQLQNEQQEKAQKLASHAKALEAKQQELQQLTQEQEARTQALEARRQEINEETARLEHVRKQPQDDPEHLERLANLDVRELKLRQEIENYQQKYEGFKQQKKMLVEVKNYLANTEEQLVKRWATQKGAWLAVGLISCLMVLSQGSYLLGYWVVKPLWRATIEFEVATDPQAAEQNRQIWLGEHKKNLLDEAVLTGTLEHLRGRGISAYPDTPAVRTAFHKQLLITESGDNRVLVEYVHRDRDMAELVLHSLGDAYIGQQMINARATSTLR